MLPIHTESPDRIPECEPLDFLVVAPHPDDAELGMGGTIAKMVDAGWRDRYFGPDQQGSQLLTAASRYAVAKRKRQPKCWAWRGAAMQGLPIDRCSTPSRLES